ncbi:MAG: hypothetical protein ACI8QS_002591 [Planctomycetota bacterium]|jgi:hypothetical protein
MADPNSRTRLAGAGVLSGSGARHTWRDADLAQKGGSRPRSVRGVVTAATRTLTALRLVEGILLGIAFGCMTLAAALLSGLATARTDAIVLALAVGLIGGLTWVIEKRRGEPEVVRALDKRMRHGGALLTAWELEGDGVEQPLGKLLISNVLDRLRLKEARFALRPSLAPPVLLPLAGAVVLGLVLDSRGPLVEVQFLPLDGLDGQLGSLGDSAFDSRSDGKIDSKSMSEVLVVRSEAQDLYTEIRLGDPPADAEERLRSLDELIGELAPGVSGDPELARDLEQMRARLDALRGALGDTEGTGGLESEGESGAEAGAEPGVGDSSDGGSSESGPGALAGDDPDGTMSRHNDSPLGAGAPNAGDGDDPRVGSERASAARVWWDRIDDPVVADWVETLRKNSTD